MDVDDVQPLDAADLPCLAEVRDVLAKHGKLDRFGVRLQHRHFDLAASEILLETCDPETRTLVSTPVDATGFEPGSVLETAWRLSSGEDFLHREKACKRDPKTGRHIGNLS
jgi:hypothetical protein